MPPSLVLPLGRHLELKLVFTDKPSITGGPSMFMYWREQGGADEWHPWTGVPYEEPYWSEFVENWQEVYRCLLPGTVPTPENREKRKTLGFFAYYLVERAGRGQHGPFASKKEAVVYAKGNRLKPSKWKVTTL